MTSDRGDDDQSTILIVSDFGNGVSLLVEVLHLIRVRWKDEGITSLCRRRVLRMVG